MSENKLTPKECLDNFYKYLRCRGCTNSECLMSDDDRTDCRDWYNMLEDELNKKDRLEREVSLLETKLGLCNRVISLLIREKIDFDFIRTTTSVTEYNKYSRLFNFSPLDDKAYRYLKYYVENVEGKYDEKF